MTTKTTKFITARHPTIFLYKKSKIDYGIMSVRHYLRARVGGDNLERWLAQILHASRWTCQYCIYEKSLQKQPIRRPLRSSGTVEIMNANHGLFFSLVGQDAEQDQSSCLWPLWLLPPAPSPFFNSLMFIYLKGQCHEIFCFWFFSWISFPPAPEYSI